MSVSLKLSLGSSSCFRCTSFCVSAISRFNFILESDNAETLTPSGSGFGFGGGITCTGCSTSSSLAGRGEMPVFLSGVETVTFCTALAIDGPAC